MAQHIPPVSLYSFAAFEMWGATSAEWTSMTREESLEDSEPEVFNREQQAFNWLTVFGAVLLTAATVVLIVMGTSSQKTMVIDQPQALIQ